MATDDARFEDLESRIAFQEDTIRALNDALVEHQNRVAKLESMMQLLIDRFNEAPWDAPDESDEVPPHY